MIQRFLFKLLCLACFDSIDISLGAIVSENIGSLRQFFGHDISASSSSTLDISFTNNNQEYGVTVNGQEWLVSGLSSFRNNGDWALVNINRTESHTGNDNFGDYNEITIFWQDTDNMDTQFATGFRTYSDSPDKIVFTQTFPNGASGMATGSENGIVSSFPSFKIIEPKNRSINLGFVHFSGFMASAMAPQFGLWKSDGNKNTFFKTLEGGFENTGALCIYETNLTIANIDNSHSLVISPLTYHMASMDNITLFNNNYEFRYGIVGNVSNIPNEYQIKFLITLSNGGINHAMYNWGNNELNYFNVKKRGNSHNRDFTLNYLGYSTDNGAYYYYETENNKNYQDTIIDIKKYVENEMIPVKYILLDSWWYYKGVNNGVKNWKAEPSIFPDGLPYLHNATDWPIQAHNRYWSLDNVYASNNPPPYNNKNNGSNLFPFSFSSYDALPKTREFWDYLFKINNDWGLIVYEQDWLSTSGDTMEILHNNVTFGRNWLMDMGLSAEMNDLSIQYCMSYPRHVMTSVELRSVTQARASNDYQPGNDQWQVGISSIFTHSIDIMPSKDSYWSMNTPQGGHYKNGTNEPYNRLQSCILTLSNGPVTFADKIGYSNKTLIMRACNNDGLLLRPDTPATAIDRYLLYLSFIDTNKTFANKYGINGQVYTTTSKISNHDRYLYLFIANLESSDNDDNYIYLNDFIYHFQNHNEYNNMDDLLKSNYLVFETNTTNKFIEFNNDKPLPVNNCGKYDFQYYTFIPMGSNNNFGDDIWYLQGEIDKWISVSTQRFQSVSSSDNGGISVTIYGAVGEIVNVAFVNGKTLEQVIVSCKISQTQTMVIRMPAQTCESY